MAIHKIKICQFRNVLTAQFVLDPRFNILVGDNAMGKTSILEAIALLTSGRSFRTQHKRHLIHHQHQSCHIYAELHDNPDRACTQIGTAKHIHQSSELKINGLHQQSLESLLPLLPTQVISPEKTLLTDCQNSERRAFIDWGVFHVEHSHWEHLKKLHKSLRQRNVLLKQHGIDHHALTAWDANWVEISETVNKSRQQYFNELSKVLDSLPVPWLNKRQIRLRYHSGWDTEINLLQLMKKSRETDIVRGHTMYGAHRSSFSIYVDKNKPAKDVLSRGQKKLLDLYLRCAQLFLLRKYSDKKFLILIDDIAAELDLQHQGTLFNILDQLQCQVVLTQVASQFGAVLPKTPYAMFHVEHGRVQKI